MSEMVILSDEKRNSLEIRGDQASAIFEATAKLHKAVVEPYEDEVREGFQFSSTDCHYLLTSIGVERSLIMHLRH